MTLIEAARTYLGTKWRHRGRSRHGVDCAGLIVLSYRDCGVELQDFTLYGRTPHNDGLVNHCIAAFGPPLPEGTLYRDGDIVVMRFDRLPHHLAFITKVDYAGQPAKNIIHADGHTGRVLEQRLTPDMDARITHLFRKEIS